MTKKTFTLQASLNSDLDLDDIHERFMKFARLNELELLSTNLSEVRDSTEDLVEDSEDLAIRHKQTPKSLAAVWGYIEQWPNGHRAFNMRIMADELGMSLTTANKHMGFLMQKHLGVVRVLNISKQSGYGASRQQYLPGRNPRIRLTDYLKSFPLYEGDAWEPLVRTWEVESPELNKMGRFTF